jgi:hypothetical protein
LILAAISHHFFREWQIVRILTGLLRATCRPLVTRLPRKRSLTWERFLLLVPVGCDFSGGSLLRGLE